MIKIDNNSSKALYEQIYDEISRLILSRALRPDEQLPSVRELASLIKVNPNTIHKAYKSLENNDYIYTIKGKGNFVKNAEELRNLHIKNVNEKLIIIIKSLKDFGFNNEEILDIIKNILNEKFK
ncbi:MAG: GntR family transcriptional regulator [Tissierellia bacterium]|nr:GntR family transcriptional regulator [Tissierellia bacterium]MDD4779480.1 GntR family transcriptional regulator [Tissierellia bacterium]